MGKTVWYLCVHNYCFSLPLLIHVLITRRFWCMRCGCFYHSTICYLRTLMRYLEFVYFAHSRRAKYCDQSVCLSVCPSARLSKKPTVQIAINVLYRTCCQWPWLDRSVNVMFHVMERIGHNQRPCMFLSFSSPSGGTVAKSAVSDCIFLYFVMCMSKRFLQNVVNWFGLVQSIKFRVVPKIWGYFADHFSGPGTAVGWVCLCVRTIAFELHNPT